MRKFVHIYLIILFLFISGIVNAQKVVSVTHVNNKKNIPLRPNSRDYGPNFRDNMFNRIEYSKDGKLFINQRPGKLEPGNLQNKTNLKNNQSLQRRQFNMFHRPL